LGNVTRSRKTTEKDLRVPVETVPGRRRADEDATNIDGPRIHGHGHDEHSSELSLEPPSLQDFDFDEDGDGFEDTNETTIDRGSRPPKPSSSRRLSPTLAKIFQRRREQIGLSILQLAKLSGVEQAELERFENTQGQHRLVYDHAVVIARVLGLKAQDLPGLRMKASRDQLREHIDELHRALVSGPMLTFEGRNGERFGGDIERVITTPAFTIKLGDPSLGEGWPGGALLGFLADAAPQAGDVVLIRHKKSKLLALRRYVPPSFLGLATWQPSYRSGAGTEWLAVGRLQVMLPRSP
jgi:transcriptional regulator with XRE-family HTH domain